MLRHLVVVVPGIGGSVLAAPDGRSAWDLSVGEVARAMIDPESVALDRELVATRLVDDLVVLRPWLVVPGYGMLTHHLRTQFGENLRVVDYRAGTTPPAGIDVLRVPYDFRRSIVEAADVLGRAVVATVGDSGRRVVVVAHSLGGLVARYWIGAGDGWRHCRALITLGTPHRGAPRALDLLFNGFGLGPLRSPGATRVLREWPSVHELLPQYPAVLSTDGRPVEIDALPPDLARSFGTPTAGVDILTRAAAAAQVHDDIAAGWVGIPGGELPALLPYFGRGNRTLNRSTIRDGRLRVEKADPEWRGNVGWFGDGTVPAIAAIPPELSTTPELAVALAEKHGPLGTAAAIKERLVTLQGDDLPTRGVDEPTMPWVGWDVEDTVPAGQGTTVGVELRDRGASRSATPGRTATLSVTGAGPLEPIGMMLGADGWQATLSPLPEGVYGLNVEVKDAWHGASVYASTPLAVLEPPEDARP